MNNIIEVAEKRDEIMASQDITCPVCSEKQYSPFDKLFVSAYGRCVDDTPEEEVELLGENIFALL